MTLDVVHGPWHEPVSLIEHGAYFEASSPSIFFMPVFFFLRQFLSLRAKAHNFGLKYSLQFKGLYSGHSGFFSDMDRLPRYRPINRCKAIPARLRNDGGFATVKKYHKHYDITMTSTLPRLQPSSRRLPAKGGNIFDNVQSAVYEKPS